MKRYLAPRNIVLFGAAGLLIAVVLGIWLWNRLLVEPKLLAADAAAAAVLAQYDGEVVGMDLAGDAYLVKLKTLDGLYELRVQRDGGGISGIRQMEAYEREPAAESEPPADPSQDGSGLSSDVDEDTPGSPPQPSTNEPDGGVTVPTKPASDLISPAEAAALAQAEVGGEVEETELQQDGDIRYYVVEIDTPSGREAAVQLNAASGAIMSIAWHEDDDDQDGSNEDDDRNGDDDGDQDDDDQP